MFIFVSVAAVWDGAIYTLLLGRDTIAHMQVSAEIAMMWDSSLHWGNTSTDNCQQCILSLTIIHYWFLLTNLYSPIHQNQVVQLQTQKGHDTIGEETALWAILKHVQRVWRKGIPPQQASHSASEGPTIPRGHHLKGTRNATTDFIQTNGQNTCSPA